MAELSPDSGPGFYAKPLCPFCSAPWSDEMVELLDVSSHGGCNSCGFGASKAGSIRIECGACERLIYQKDYHN